MKRSTILTAAALFLLGFLIVLLVGRSIIGDLPQIKAFTTTVLIVMGVTLALLILLFYKSFKELNETSHDLKALGKALADGNYAARVVGAHHTQSVLRSVAIELNEMAEQLETSSRSMQEKTARLDAILNSMIDPLVMVDQDLWVHFMNTSASRIFSRHLAPDANPFPLILLTGSEATERLAREANAKGQASEEGIAMLTSKGRREFDVVAVPVRVGGGSDHTILIFDDRTDEHRLQDMRAEFVANVTHELKSPLTSIRGFIETLRHSNPSDEAVRERFLDIIDIEAERLEQLISDILVLSEIESMKSERNVELVNLNDVVEELLVLFDDKAAEKKITIYAETEGDGVMVTANPNRLRQIFINLIDNAIKYADQGGKIWVDCERTLDHRVLISVRDNGKGIDPDHQTRIFERFYRVDRGRNRAGGTGLGLSIVKHIAQLYQGKAWVESEPGRGATFFVSLTL